MKKLSFLTAYVAFLGFTLGSFALVANSVKAQPFTDNTEVAAAASAQETGEAAGTDRNQTSPVAPGRKQKITGVIVKHEAGSLTVRDQSGSVLTVHLADTTKVVENKRNPFRGAKRYSRDDLIPGLDVEIEGRGDSAGALVAERIRFTQEALNVARAIRSQVMPVEEGLGKLDNRLRQTEQNAQRLSGQVDELAEASNIVRGEARDARARADRAMEGVSRTNERISTLDEYEVMGSATINFKVGSSVLSPEAKAQLDQIATEAKVKKGYIIEVAGFASSEGPEDRNRRLSQRRAEAVVRYLVEEHMIPVRRILIPFGYGERSPVADNSTRDGRQQNRRAEVKLLVNRGQMMSESESSPTTANDSPERR